MNQRDLTRLAEQGLAAPATKADIVALAAALAGTRRRLELRLTLHGVVIAALFGLFFTALHYWPPHG